MGNCPVTNGYRTDLFPVVNFGSDPEGSFKALREILPKGPLMCGEFYPGWFDTWGAPHHTGKTDTYLRDLEYMLKQGASFSIYMVHGGTTFGFYTGAGWHVRGLVVRYNYLHDILGYGRTDDRWTSPHFAWGIYLDDDTYNFKIYRNVVWNTTAHGIFLYGTNGTETGYPANTPSNRKVYNNTVDGSLGASAKTDWTVRRLDGAAGGECRSRSSWFSRSR